MPSNKAKNIFLGQNGEKRQNCAQAVLSTFKETMKVDENLIDLARGYGGGQAPQGLCGAYYAAKLLIEKYCCPKQAQNFEQFFQNLAGSLKCHDIRGLRKLSCLGCVEKAAEFIASHHKHHSACE